MRARIFPFLALLLIISVSLTFVGCNDDYMEVEISNLSVSPKNVAVDHATNISVVVTNHGSRSRTYNATCFVDGSIIGSKTVNLAAKANQTVTFDYTPTRLGTLNVTIGSLSTTLESWDHIEPFWDITYNVVNGSKITLNYSAGKTAYMQKEFALERGDGAVTLLVRTDVINGTREVLLPSSGWTLPSIYVEKFYLGLDMNLSISLAEDATGLLYVQDGIGDVDVSSVSSIGENEIQVNIYGDGEMDAAGSLLVETFLQGQAYIQTGETLNLPLGLTFTTGNITNMVSSAASEKFTGAILVSTGVCFAREVGIVPYVGTNGTITTTGTGNCLGLTFRGLPLDLQVEIKLVLEPEL